MSLEARTMEEYVYGPEGDEDRSVVTGCELAKEEGAKLDVQTISLECRAFPQGVSTSRQEWIFTYPSDSPPVQVVQAILKRLEQSPGDGFTGTIRLRWRDLANSKTSLHSYSRKVRNLVLADSDNPDGGTSSGRGIYRAVYDDLHRPAHEMTLRYAEATTRLIHGCADLMRSSHPPAAPQQQNDNGSAGMLPDLLSAVVGAATGANNVDRARHAGNAAQTVYTNYYPSAPAITGNNPPAPIAHPPSFAPPSPFRALPGPADNTRQIAGPTNGHNFNERATIASKADAERWARANPAQAEELVRSLLRERLGQ